MNEVWLQLIITGGTVIGGIFLTIRYSMKQVAKREQALLSHTEKTQQNMLEYFETKNGHMERMSKSFILSSNKMSKALSKLSEEIAVLSSKHK